MLSGVHEVFVALETEHLFKSVALQAQSSSAYSSYLLMRGEFPETLCIEQGVSGAFLRVCRVEGSMDFSCALDGCRESVK